MPSASVPRPGRRPGRHFSGVLALAGWIWAAGCQPPPPGVAAPRPMGRPLATSHAPIIRAVTAGQLQNLFSLNERVWSGAAPRGDADFATLAKLGVRTLISVDGAAPDVAAAGRHGLRYVHIPLGYDGLGPTNALRLAQAATVLPGPLYVHCHHGHHRGPAAASVVSATHGGWSPATVNAWLHLAGTSTNYPGLYRDAAGFQCPPRPALQVNPATFTARAPVTELVDTMVQIDQHAEALTALRANGYRAPAERPDLVPAHEALQLAELLREAHRTGQGARHGDTFRAALDAAATHAQNLQRELQAFAETKPGTVPSTLESAYQSVQRACVNCHRQFRN